MRMSENLMWVPDRCRARICTSIVSISRRRYEGEIMTRTLDQYTLRHSCRNKSQILKLKVKSILNRNNRRLRHIPNDKYVNNMFLAI